MSTSFLDDKSNLANEKLILQNQEEEIRSVKLTTRNRELVGQTAGNEKSAAELVIAIKELVHQSEEKAKRAAELAIANVELLFQNEEKGKRAAELAFANAELLFRNKEKQKRAAELVIANEELLFQNEEKGKRAAELAIANAELLFQNEEKGKRAAELVIANEELVFQNIEKGKRAAELAMANIELRFQNEQKEQRAEELISSNRDLTIAEEKLIGANKELESFSYSVAHDLRAPLRAISGYSKMLKINFVDRLDAEGNRLINNIMSSATKMGQLIDDLLKFSRVGRKALTMMNVQMQEMVTSVCNELKSEQGDRRIDIHVNGLLPVQADAFTIRQVWLNLIANAIKYTNQRENAVIEIGSQEVANEIVYYIRDNGAGFDMRYADKLFGVFQRLHSDEEFEGAGVGLALVQRIIHKHGGRVWAEGKVNEGATFYFALNVDLTQ